MDTVAIEAWIGALDTLTYYDLLGVSQNAGADDIRQGFYAFATSFHPDGHAMRPAGERQSIDIIFKRGTEAYRVLSDPDSRLRYDEARASGSPSLRLSTRAPRPQTNVRTRPPPPSLRPEPLATPGTDPPGAPRGRLEDFVRQVRARPFAQKAEELAKKKEYGKAKLELKLAMSMDPNNAVLEAYLAELDAEMAERGWNRPR